MLGGPHDAASWLRQRGNTQHLVNVRAAPGGGVTLCRVRSSRLAIYETLEVSRISVSLDADCGDGIVDGLQIVRCQFHVCAAEIVFEAV